MSSSTVSTLVIDVVTEAEKATKGMDAIGSSSSSMASDVESANDRAARSFNVTADSTDQLASKSSQATGALGALSSGLELVGLDQYAAGLQGASLATDFMSGVGDSLNLVLESTAVKSALARANMIRQAVTSRVVAGATRVWAAGQWVLNAALNANPIGLVVAAALVLVGLLILLYRHSSRFRQIVQAVGKAGQVAIGFVVSKVSDLVGWVKNSAPAAFRALQLAAKLYLGLMLFPIKAVVTAVRDVIKWVATNLPAAFGVAKQKASDIGSALLSPFKNVLQTIKDIVSWIGKIKVPHIPNPFSRIAGGSNARVVDPGELTSTASGAAAGTGTSGTVVRITNVIQGAIDPLGTASTVTKAQETAARRLGLKVI